MYALKRPPCNLIRMSSEELQIYNHPPITIQKVIIKLYET